MSKVFRRYKNFNLKITFRSTEFHPLMRTTTNTIYLGAAIIRMSMKANYFNWLQEKSKKSLNLFKSGHSSLTRRRTRLSFQSIYTDRMLSSKDIETSGDVTPFFQVLSYAIWGFITSKPECKRKNCIILCNALNSNENEFHWIMHLF